MFSLRPNESPPFQRCPASFPQWLPNDRSQRQVLHTGPCRTQTAALGVVPRLMILNDILGERSMTIQDRKIKPE
ncbi:MAG: hypothetical protein WCE20_13435, partial [Rhizomicrobium sp.]